MNHYDLIVIGGGPAGIFAAGFAAGNGAKVLLLEKNHRCGAKLLITGKGRCNLANSETDPRKLAENFGRNGRALLTALYAFGVPEVIEFFESRGLQLQIERGGRIFPKQGKAVDVQQVLDGFLQETGVAVQTDCRVLALNTANKRLSSVTTDRGEFSAAQFLLATGGLSYPETGCTGDGYAWARQTGHRLVATEPALVPVRLAESWTSELCDFNLKNVRISLRQQQKVLAERFGEAFFTRQGIGGPIVLDMSAEIRDALKAGAAELLLDLKPAISAELFDQRLQRELAAHNNKDFANSLAKLLPKKLIPLFVRLAGIEPHKKCHSVSKTERHRLLQLFKALPLQVTGVAGFDKAIVTSGGVALQDIDMRSMRSKKIENLSFSGELLDLDGPTGGFNLQVCWSTGYLAGVSIAESLQKTS